MKRTQKRNTKESKKKKRNFWADGFTIDETRFSMLALLSVVGFGYALYADYSGGIEDNLLSLVNSVLLAFVGVNVADKVSKTITSRKSDKEDVETYNDDEEGGM